MPELETAGVRLNYEVSGNADGNVLVFGNSLGSNLRMWDRALPSFEARFRVIRFDTRGHGRSSVPTGPYSIDDLGRDVLDLLDALGVKTMNFCGLSLGGMVGMWLGIHAPQRVQRLVMANTGARIATREMWQERIELVNRGGMDALAELTPSRWFTAEYREQHPEEMEMIRRMVAATDVAGYARCCGVLRDTDLSGEIAKISLPALVIVGTHDPATPAADGLAVHCAVRDSKYVELDASHLSAWERASEFAAEVITFLATEEVCNA